MIKEFCPRDCEHLSVTETEQNNGKMYQPHICTKYDVKLYHLLAHPDLYRCEQCYKEDKE